MPVVGMHSDHSQLTRRQVLTIAGGTLAVGAFGIRPALAQADCQGAPLEPTPENPSEIYLRSDDPTASNIPESSELVIYIHGYNTPAVYGRRLARTFETALKNHGYTAPVVGAPWRATPDQEGDGQQAQADRFTRAVDNADADGRKLAQWLKSNAGDRTIRLVGYSLGTRVALRTATELDGDAVDLDTVSLLGAAVPAEQICPDGPFSLAAPRAVFNYRSKQDGTICDTYAAYLAAFAAASPPALGCGGPACAGSTPENLVDRNVTATVTDHCAYGFPEVGVVQQVATDFETPLSEIDRTSSENDEDDSTTDDDQTTPATEQTQTDGETASQNATQSGQTTEGKRSTGSGDDSDANTATGADNTSDASNGSTDGGGPGLGVFSALSGLAGYLFARRVGNREQEPSG